MGFLGLDFFKTKEQLNIEQKVFNQMIFPYGDKQKEKIKELLSSLISNETKENLLYNYIVTKQKIEKVDVSSLSKKELINLIDELDSQYITNNNEIAFYLMLAMYDLKIDTNLLYPNKETIIQEANSLIEKTK